MEISAIFLLLGVLVIVVLFVVQPFTEHWRAKAQSSREVSSLLAERERILNALQELDFDQELRKVPAEEYTLQREDLLGRGAEILRRLDEVQAKQAHLPEHTPGVKAANTKNKSITDEDLEEMIAKRRSQQVKKPAGFCSKCGMPISQSDKFCSSCGESIGQVRSQPLTN